MTGMTGRNPLYVGLTTLDADLASELAALSLSDADAARAAAYRAADDRRRFLLGRWLLRSLAADATGLAPERIQLDVDLAGRPTLIGDASGLFVSLAHSGQLVVAAVADVAVGVDVEELPTRALHPRLEARICSPAELGTLSRLKGPARQTAFMAIWVRKEAYGKALGVGLDFPLRTATVVPGARVLGVPGRFWVAGMNVAPGYASAIVAEGRARQVDFQRYP